MLFHGHQELVCSGELKDHRDVQRLHEAHVDHCGIKLLFRKGMNEPKPNREGKGTDYFRNA